MPHSKAFRYMQKSNTSFKLKGMLHLNYFAEQWPSKKEACWMKAYNMVLITTISYIRGIHPTDQNHFAKHHCSTQKYYEGKAVGTLFCIKQKKNLFSLKHLVGCETQLHDKFNFRTESVLLLVMIVNCQLNFRNQQYFVP